MSAYAISQDERLQQCLKSIQDVIHSRHVEKDCRTPIFGFAATALLTLTFIILQDNVERKARAMGVWEIINGLRILRHNEPMDAERLLINNLRSKIRGQISKDRERRRGDMMMKFINLSPKEIILTFNENTSDAPLDIPEPLFVSSAFTNVERTRYAAWRNTTHVIPWVPACNANPLTQFDRANWQSWHWLTRAEFVYAACIHGTPKQLLGTRGPVFEYCDSMAHGMAANRGELTALSTDAEVRAMAEAYDVLVDLSNTSVSMQADHRTSVAVDKALNDQALLFFNTSFSPSILAPIKAEILREDWAAAYAAIVARYSTNVAEEKLPVRDIEAAIKTLKHDPYKAKVAETLVVFDSLMVVLNLAHYVNAPPHAPRPGATLTQVKHNLRESLPLSDAAFAIAHPGVTRHVEAHTSREFLLHVFQGVEHFQSKVDSWTYDKTSINFATIREGLIALEKRPLKPINPTPFAANVSSPPTAPNPSSEDTLSALAVNALSQGSPIMQVPCIICTSNTLRDFNGNSHDAARCRAVKFYAESPLTAQQKGFTKSLFSLQLPPAAELMKIGVLLGPMRKTDYRSPPSKDVTNERKRSPSPSTSSYSNARARTNSNPGSRQQSRAPSPSNRTQSPGDKRGRAPSPARTQDSPSADTLTSSIRAILNSSEFKKIVRDSVAQTVKDALNEK